MQNQKPVNISVNLATQFWEQDHLQLFVNCRVLQLKSNGLKYCKVHFIIFFSVCNAFLIGDDFLTMEIQLQNNHNYVFW